MRPRQHAAGVPPSRLPLRRLNVRQAFESSRNATGGAEDVAKQYEQLGEHAVL